LLEALDAAGPEGVTLGALTARTGLKAPTGHNLLKTLVELGYAAHDTGTRRYSLGEKTWSLGRRRFLDEALSDAAQPVLRELHAEFNETVLLALFRHGHRHTVASIESGHGLRVGLGSAVDTNLYGSATGRLLLSRVEPAVIDRFAKDHGLPGKDWPEATAADALYEELRRIREERFVLCDRPGTHVRAVAVPVSIPEPDMNIALGMYYPVARPPRGGMRRLRRCLTEAASAITAHYERTGT
jgi:DNA-binding IclR family transcriptional regulator